MRARGLTCMFSLPVAVGQTAGMVTYSLPVAVGHTPAILTRSGRASCSA